MNNTLSTPIRVPLFPSCHYRSYHIKVRVVQVLNSQIVCTAGVKPDPEVNECLDGCKFGATLVDCGGFWLIGRCKRDLEATVVGKGVTPKINCGA